MSNRTSLNDIAPGALAWRPLVRVVGIISLASGIVYLLGHGDVLVSNVRFAFFHESAPKYINSSYEMVGLQTALSRKALWWQALWNFTAAGLLCAGGALVFFGRSIGRIAIFAALLWLIGVRLALLIIRQRGFSPSPSLANELIGGLFFLILACVVLFRRGLFDDRGNVSAQRQS